MTLFHFAYQSTSDGRVVEIGSFLGKSTAWMATALKLRQIQDRIIAIDPHRKVKDLAGLYDVESLLAQCRRIEGSMGIPLEEVTTYDLWVDNLAQLQLSGFVEPVRAPSSIAAKDWNEPIRLLFVDGSHVYEDVLADLQHWEPWVSPRGILCVHDTKPDGPFPGVARAVAEYLSADTRFRQLLHTENLTVFEKLGERLLRNERPLPEDTRHGIQ
jgi:hypothetical protein